MKQIFVFLPRCSREKINDLKMFSFLLGEAFTPYCKEVERVLESGPLSWIKPVIFILWEQITKGENQEYPEFPYLFCLCTGIQKHISTSSHVS